MGYEGGGVVGVVSSMHRMHGCSHAGHVHLGRSHDGTLLFGFQFMCLLTLMSVNHLVVGWTRRVLARAWTTLLYWLV